MLSNIAFSLSLYSGQMCTTPQNILVSRDGIRADGSPVGVDQFAQDLADAVNGLLGDDRRATALLGGIVNDDVSARIDAASSLGDVVLESRSIVHPEFPDAVVRTPTIIRVDAASDAHQSSASVPLPFSSPPTTQYRHAARTSVREHGAITAAVYSTDDKVLHAAEEAALDGGVALSENLTQGVYVNQSAAFSDFHATGANPAANAALTDAAFVANRFRVVQSRHHI